MKKTEASQSLTYETAYAELQRILVEIQDETTSIDRLTAQIARANELILFCKTALRTTEQELDALTRRE